MHSFSDLTVDQFLWSVASEAPAPGGGAVAALVAAQAAALAGMTGRNSTDRRAANTAAISELIIASDGLRDTCAPLADDDAVAYESYLRAVRLPREPDPDARSAAIAEATSTAADVPLRTAKAAAEVAQIAERLVELGNKNLRGDAAAAALLAAAAATAASIMVADNLSKEPDDPRIARAIDAAAAARNSARTAVDHFPSVAQGLAR